MSRPSPADPTDAPPAIATPLRGAANVDDDDDCARLRQALDEAEGDLAAGRTASEGDVRALLRAMSR